MPRTLALLRRLPAVHVDGTNAAAPLRQRSLHAVGRDAAEEQLEQAQRLVGPAHGCHGQSPSCCETVCSTSILAKHILNVNNTGLQQLLTLLILHLLVSDCTMFDHMSTLKRL